MKFVADEGVERGVVERLRLAEHSVVYVMELERGISDDEVLALAIREEALLITADKDFGELLYRQGRAARGIVLLRLAGLSEEAKADVVATAVSEHLDELPQAFAVIEPGYVRIRHGAGS